MDPWRIGWVERARRLSRRVPVLAVWLAAAGGVWLLSSRGLLATLSKGYAEAQTHSVAPLRAGRVKALRVEPGRPVKAGDVVAEMDGSDLEARSARLRADALRRDRQSSVAAADLARDRAERDELALELKRAEGLVAEKLIPLSEVEPLRRRFAALNARVGVASRSGVAGTAPMDGELAAATAELERERAALLLRAPVDGEVASITRRSGEAVSGGGEVLQIVTARPGHVVTWVHEKLARTVATGMKAKVQRAEFLGGSFSGTVVGVSPQLDEFPPRFRAAPDVPVWGRRVLIKLDTDEKLLPGELFHVRF